VTGLETTAGFLSADAFVLAAGIQSRSLAATAGISLPLYPLKGYSLTAPIRADDVAPQISVTDFERKVLYARIGDKLRVAALVDMVGEDLSLDQKRLAGLTRQARATMPRAADYSQVTPWAGLRPATPNSAPIIGATQYPNLWLNLGHGPLGFTFACGTATVLAGLMQGKAPPFALDGLTLRG
jgi:D-amino-acid dehydrogenase